ncbi:MAG: SRPBCC family protein [Hyphomonadaceae bacterium]
MRAEGDPDFVYVTYIRASREKVWAALTGRAERAWWAGTTHETDFKPGSALTFRRNGNVDVRGKIVESQPPARLVYTFHVEGPGPQHDEGETRVTYELAEDGEATKLTVIHGGFVKNSKVKTGISNGWPAILSGLKSALETGRELDLAQWARRDAEKKA